MSIRDKKGGVIKNYFSGLLRGLIVALLILLQLAMIIALSLWLTSYTVYIYVIIEIASIIIMVGLVNENKSPSYKIGWICIILVLPLTGHIMYLLWGSADSSKKLMKMVDSKFRHGESFYSYDKELIESFEKKYPTKSRIARFLESHSFPLTKNNDVKYFPSGEDAFESIINDLKKAEHFILINFYIVAEGKLWDEIHEIIKEKAANGVEVKLFYDDFGSMFRTPKTFRHMLMSENIEVRVFSPVHRYTEKLYMNYRSHQKIVVIDGNIGYTGGINLADEYANLVERFGYWKDTAVRIEGDAVWGMTVTFFQMWESAENNTTIDYSKYKPTEKFPPNDVYCQFVSDGPANNPKNPVINLYKQISFYAKKYLYITTPYMIIEDDMEETLITAKRSGIDVRIITPGIPDKKMVNYLTKYNYGKLLHSGVRIYEYTPGFIHAKMIINEDCGVVGTINMDYRSFYLHYECGAFICNRGTINAIKSDIEKTFEMCHEVTYDEWKKRPWYMRLCQRVLNLFATLM